MHPTVMRLLEGARRATEKLPTEQRVENFLDLQRALDISSATLSNWKTRGVSQKGAMEAEARLRVPAAWVQHGLLQGPTLGSDWPSNTGALPLIAMDSTAGRYILTPVNTPWEALMQGPLNTEFQTTMPDASMAPDVPSGARIILITGVEAKPGDFVLIADAQGNVYLREYKQTTPSNWEAHARNPAFLPLHSQRDGLRVLAVFDGMRGRRAAT